MEVKRKNSKKRTAILEALASFKEHPTAEMLYNALKPEIPELSLGTVYRNLAVLAQEGLVVSVAHVDGQERYDACTHTHAHFICRKCSRVLDIEMPELIAPVCERVSAETGCETESYSLAFHGLCDRCKEAGM